MTPILAQRCAPAAPVVAPHQSRKASRTIPPPRAPALRLLASTTQQQSVAAMGTPAHRSSGYAVLEAKAKLVPWAHDLPPQLKADEVEVTVTHSGVCHTDIHMRDNDWFVSKFPFIPGHEVVGVVRAVGSEVKTLLPGQRVGVGWMRDSCRRCPACLRGEENLCEPGYTGLIVGGNHGGFQAVLRVPSDFAFSIPDALPSADAAPLLCAGITVYAPLKRWLTRPGMNIAVLGIGGLGHLAIQFANVMGANVTAIDIAPEKEAEARRLGAIDFQVFGNDLADRMPGKFDVILNTASAHIPTGPLLRLLRNDGVLVQIGIPGDRAQMTLPLTDVVFGQKKVAGSIVGGRRDMDEMLRLAAAKSVRPMIEVMPSHKINEAFSRLASGKARYRVVLTMDPKEDPSLVAE